MNKNEQALSAAAFCIIFALALLTDGIADLVAPFPNSEVEDKPVAVEAVSTPAPSPVPTPEPTPDYSYIPLDAGLAGILVESCQREDVPLELALAVIERESGFDVEALNQATGCYGLMQLNPDYFPAGLVPEENIRAGVAYLGGLLKTYGDEAHAVTAYYYGPTDCTSSWYSDEVLARAEDWRAER